MGNIIGMIPWLAKGEFKGFRGLTKMYFQDEYGSQDKDLTQPLPEA